MTGARADRVTGRLRVVVAALAAGACGLAAGGCGREAPPERRVRPSLLLVTIDTLRADRVGAYGGPAGLTPNLDRLAREGTVFDEAVASVPLTLPSHATILSGLEPPRHGVHDNGTYVFPSDLATLATRLQAEGYETAAFMGAHVLDRRFGLARGFDVYDDRVPRGETRGSVLEAERKGSEVAAAATAWLVDRAGPFFAWVHLYDPHAPYDPPAEFRERWPDRPYESEVAYADDCLGRLLDAARNVSARRKGAGLVVAATADHGEALGEHGELTHGFFVYESTLRVPLLLSGPGVGVGQRRAGPARTADLLPTLLALLGLPAAPGLDGVDLFGPARPREAYGETVYPRSFGWAGLRSLRLGTLKLIEGSRAELFDLEADPAETRNIAPERPEAVARLRGALRAFRGASRAASRAPADRESAERLRALGYVVGPGEPPNDSDDEERPDPRDRVPAYRAYEEATWAGLRGDLDRAIAGLRSLSRADPRNAVFRLSLASALRRAGRPAEAARALEGGPWTAREDAVLWHERALALAAAGRRPEAEASERRALAANPLLPGPHNHLGLLLARRGELGEALARFEAATGLDPNDAVAWCNRGNALRGLGRGDEAASAYRTAHALDPASPDPLNGLGALLVQSGRFEEAAGTFRAALERAPRHHEARLNLAVALAQGGKVAEARRELAPLLAVRGEVGDRARQFSAQLD